MMPWSWEWIAIVNEACTVPRPVTWMATSCRVATAMLTGTGARPTGGAARAGSGPGARYQYMPLPARMTKTTAIATMRRRCGVAPPRLFAMGILLRGGCRLIFLLYLL